MIHVKDLRVDFDNVCAVQDLTLEIGPGEVYGLIGPNGAGKTTTMRALLGLIEPTYGEIELAGVDIRERPQDASRLVGFMPDFPPMYDDLKVWEFLDLFAAAYDVPRDERTTLVDKHLDLVGLTEKRDSMIPELSRGMRQRLMLAKTLVPGPQVILLDEPASGMDPNGRIELKLMLRKLSDEGRTILVSSHILTEMSEFCTSVGIMERGRMVVSGRVEDVAAQVLGTSSVLQMEILGSSEELEARLVNVERCGPRSWQGNRVEFSYEGTPDEMADLLKGFVLDGVRVVSFSRKKENLEEVFLKVGAKELS
jgi:ABC-2 type transport system ATP-binding protein